MMIHTRPQRSLHRAWWGWRSDGMRGIMPAARRIAGRACYKLWDRFSPCWAHFWMRYAGRSTFGRLATRLATWAVPPYKARRYLAELNPNGYVAPSASILHPDVRFGAHVFIGDRVIIYRDYEGGPVELGDGVELNPDCVIEIGRGGSVIIGAHTYIQTRCQLTSVAAPIRIGRGVLIGPNCAFYPYDHGIDPGQPICSQPNTTKGGIVVDDEAWLGFGVIVLSGVRIGKGAVVGAGSVVTKDIPDNAVAVGVPARVVKKRNEP
jgi:acetyltransferase-like isoleucine patch superfamily enzyme